ncbi:MAG: hypothetical protein CMH25_04670 [Micavibrio sp.]|nr:hypothetical protein [Micavibrio sp.]|tara:strand:+ start:111 stop:773 length:663 start_codon:yes stop_codon:yes gene_type:complete
MSDMMRDVDESLKKEKLEKLWKEYGPTLIVSAVALVILTGVFSAYEAWQHKKQTSITQDYINALSDPNAYEEVGSFTEDKGGKLGGLSYLQKAALAKAEDKNDAVALYYKELSESKSATPILRDLGTILYTAQNLTLSAKEMTGLDEAMTDKLSDIAEDNDNPWQAYAVLFQGLMRKHLEGDTQGAIAILSDFDVNEDNPDLLSSQIIALSDFYAQSAPQ